MLLLDSSISSWKIGNQFNTTHYNNKDNILTPIIEPHGGTLCELLVKEDIKSQLQKESITFKSLTLNDRQLCDIEMLLNGGFSPLVGFLGQSDYESVLKNNRLSDGTVWPIPITLDVSEEPYTCSASSLRLGDHLSVRFNTPIATPS